MISRRTTYRWVCACGAQWASVVWRVVAQSERPEVLRPDAPGLVEVRCDACGAEQPIDDAVLILRSSRIAPVVAALARSQLNDPGRVVEALAAELGPLPVPLVVAPRDQLPLLLCRDVDVDVLDPGAAAAQVRDETGDDAAARDYWRFLQLALQSDAADLPRRLVLTLFDQPPDDMAQYLREHPQAYGPEGLAAAERMRAAAEAAGDAPSHGFLRLGCNLLAAVAAGTDPHEAVATYLDEVGSFNDRVVVPYLNRLRELGERGGDPEAVEALRELVARLEGHPNPAGPLREALALLGARLLARHDPAADGEAIAVLERARTLSPTRDVTWVNSTGNAAVGYGRRTLGDRLQDWGRSIALLREALAAPAADSRSVGVNATNLGLALADRPGGSSRADLDEAISWLTRALADRPPEVSVEDWAFTKVNLGLAYQRRQAPGDVAAAVGHHRDVASRLAGEDLPRLLVHAQLNLARALLNSDLGDPTAALEAALLGGRSAAGLDDAFLLAWAARLEGDARAALVGRNDDPVAIDAWRRSVAGLDDVIDAAQLLDNAGVLAGAYAATQQWEPLAQLYIRMLAALDLLYAAQTTPEGRRQRLAGHSRLARWAAYVLARTGRVEAAIDALEQARTRELAASVARDTADLEALDRADPDLGARYRAVAARYRAAATAPVADSGARSDAAAAHDELRATIKEVRAIPGLRRFLLQPVGDLLRECGATRVVYLASAPAGTYILTAGVGANGDVVHRARSVPDVSSADVARLLIVDPATREPGLLLVQESSREDFRRALNRLAAGLDPVLTALREVLAGELSGSEPTVLVPTGLFGLAPLLTLPLPGGSTIDDLYALRVAPSLGIYTACRRRANRAAVPAVLTALADTQPYPHNLPGARGEVEVIAARPGWSKAPDVACGADATLAWFVEHAPDATHLHFACHGYNAVDDPAGSSLVLAGVDTLGAAALAPHRLHARVAVASACQSGQFEAAEVPDEFIGLAAGLLQAGAACAVVSLWPVSDEATALLMTRFYELLDPGGVSGMNPPEALREARLWLRDLTDMDRAAYLADRPTLAATLRERSLPMAVGRGGSGPYAGLDDWGAFVAYGT